MTNRSDARVQFLGLVLVDAIEHDDYGFCYTTVLELGSEWPDRVSPDAHAVIRPRGDYADDYPADQSWRVDLDTIARGIGVIRDAVLKPLPDGSGEVLHNRKTGERLYLGQHIQKEIVKMDRSNGDEGDTDVVGYLAILECALFGRVVYN